MPGACVDTRTMAVETERALGSWILVGELDSGGSQRSDCFSVSEGERESKGQGVGWEERGHPMLDGARGESLTAHESSEDGKESVLGTTQIVALARECFLGRGGNRVKALRWA